MTALALSITLVLSLLVAPLAARAQPAAKVHRIGRLGPGFPPTPTRPNPSVEAFRQGLRDLGYVEGQTIVLEERWAEGKLERLPEFAAELVRLQVEVLVAGGSSAIRAAQQATRSIPIVMAGTSDAVAAGFVASLAHPGGNITGLSDLSAELPGKRLGLLKETVPQSTRIAVLAHPATPYYGAWMHTLTVAAQALGVHLHVVALHRAEELDAAFMAMTHAGADALIVLDYELLSGLYGRVADLAAQHRLPAMYSWRELVVAGGLMSYGPSQTDINRRTATYVDKILKGAKPGDLPVEQPTKFELVINLKTAQALGLTMPPSILLQADEVIR
jgi:ABC-type uncharacterized transport system substrate-binding protein